MPASERAICRRLAEFRKATKLSQAQFCVMAGINHRAYAGYEYQRSQLNYPAAWKILTAFDELNAAWLAEGAGKMLERRHFDYPLPNSIEFGPRVPFSLIYESRIKPHINPAPGTDLDPTLDCIRLFKNPMNVAGLVEGKNLFGSILSDLLAALPPEKVNDFLTELHARALQIMARYPRDPDDFAILDRIREIEEYKRRRLFFDQSYTQEKQVLTEASNRAILPPVKLQLENLLARAEALTQEAGSKSALADLLGAPLASVSRWLSGDREPGGETTLRLLQWVEQTEADQKRNAGSVSAQPARKTRIRKSQHEKQTSGPQKQ